MAEIFELQDLIIFWHKIAQKLSSVSKKEEPQIALAYYIENIPTEKKKNILLIQHCTLGVSFAKLATESNSNHTTDNNNI